MIRLTKAKSTKWNGNGMGTANAEWVVADDPTIAIRNLSQWCAIRDGEVIATGSTRARLLSHLARKLH
tara:strand:+ start:795 stop:998 length:204 start_codon:yes stop_codon:yes gene_type:complete